MDKNTFDYRTTHRRCKFCKYVIFKPAHLHLCRYYIPDCYRCILKDKTINIQRNAVFCKYYEIAAPEKST